MTSEGRISSKKVRKNITLVRIRKKWRIIAQRWIGELNERNEGQRKAISPYGYAKDVIEPPKRYVNKQNSDIMSWFE